jgi:hypothetical protein
MVALLDSGSVRSALSAESFQRLKESNPSLVMAPVSFRVVTASRQPLQVFGEVRLKVKINGFSWVFPFLVSPDMAVPLILDTDFFVKTGLVLNMRDSCFHFRFAPNSHVSFHSISCFM